MIASSSFALYAAMGISYYQKLQPISIGSPAQKVPSHLLSDAGARGGKPAVTNKYCSATLNNLQYIDFTKNNQNFTAEDVRFVAQLVCAEAGNQPYYQFSCILDGGFDKAKNNISDTDVQAVLLEIDEETDPDILFFTAYEYGKYGTPAYSIGDHYFCTR
jgi:spore germination cell wall hydrolase CwlJ-like protein